MMNSDEYKAILQTHLLLTMRRDFPDGDSSFSRISHHAILHVKCLYSLEKVDWRFKIGLEILLTSIPLAKMIRRLQEEDYSIIFKIQDVIKIQYAFKIQNGFITSRHQVEI